MIKVKERILKIQEDFSKRDLKHRQLYNFTLLLWAALPPAGATKAYFISYL
jgi:hypothetical protein